MITKETKINTDKALKIEYLIQNGYKELEIHRQIFNTIDQKVMWFFTFVSTIQWYLIVNFFIQRKLNLFISQDFVLILVLIIWFIILWLQIYILKWKLLATWPHTSSQTNRFKGEKTTLLDIKSDTLGTLNESSSQNSKIVWEKGKYFRYSINTLVLYFVFIIIYFLILSYVK